MPVGLRKNNATRKFGSNVSTTSNCARRGRKNASSANANMAVDAERDSNGSKRTSRSSIAAPASDVTSASSSVKPVPPQYQTFGRKQNSIAAVTQVRNRKRSERASAKMAGNMNSDETMLIARNAWKSSRTKIRAS